MNSEILPFSDMKVHKAQISLYALDYQGDRGELIREFWRILKAHGIDFRSNALSTLAWGERDKLLEAIVDAYRKLEKYGIILDVKLSSTGPPPDYFVEAKELD